MYFASRVQAGRMLAAQISPKYTKKRCAVLALDDGGAMVGLQIAAELHCVMTVLLSNEIMLPREPEAIAGLNTYGGLTYNPAYAEGDLVEMKSEYFSLIEQEKMTGMHELNRLAGRGQQVSRNLLKGRNVIIVTDGLKTGFLLDMAIEYLKPIELQKIIIAAPFAGVQAVDRMHVLADDLFCLNVLQDYIDTDHYYDKKDVPDHTMVLKTVETLASHWK